jgi:hypothetical protein
MSYYEWERILYAWLIDVKHTAARAEDIIERIHAQSTNPLLSPNGWRFPHPIGMIYPGNRAFLSR